jgi:hypothetical protein
VKNFGAGAALGLLLGLLIGLSASEVVAGVATGLVGLLAALLGLRSEDAAGVLPGGNSARVAGFGVAMAAAVLAGVAIRTHGLLEPSPAASAERWVRAGLSTQDAAALVVFERTGLLPESRSVATASRSAAGTGALFSEESLGACDALLSRSYPTSAALESALVAEGGAWADLAAGLRPGIDETARRERLQGAVEALCHQR